MEVNHQNEFMLRRVFGGSHLFVVIVIIFSIVSSTRNMITGRNQLAFLPEMDLQDLASKEYKQFLKTNSVISSNADENALMVKRVGQHLANAISAYYASRGYKNSLSGYKWEFNLVSSPEVNAWCLPGGKVIVYTGLLRITKNEAALAVVVGHEIAHAIAKHGNERMSQALIANGIGIAGSILTSGNRQINAIFENVYGPSSDIGVLLPNSRRQELEADRFGLIFTALAGYDPREATTLWKRMQASSLNKAPEFLSTHPNEESRINELRRFMPQALNYYKLTGRRK